MIPIVDFAAEPVIEALRTHGVGLCPGFLDADRVAAIRADVDAILESTPTGRNDFEGYKTRRIYNVFGKTRAFDDLAIHPVLLDVLQATIGQPQLSAPVGIDIGPDSPAQGLHRDDGVYPLPNPHPDVVLNTMWALQDFTRENGATRFVPGSHLWDRDRRPTEDEIVDAEMPAGSVAVYVGSVLHGGGANSTSSPRLGVILEYVAAWLRPQENHVIGVPPDVVATLPEALQELLGYNIHPPFLGYVDGRHPRRFLPASS